MHNYFVFKHFFLLLFYFFTFVQTYYHNLFTQKILFLPFKIFLGVLLRIPLSNKKNTHTKPFCIILKQAGNLL